MAASGLQADFEYGCMHNGIYTVAGVDEVGRGALAGPVVAAAYLLKSSTVIVDGVQDSKKLTAKTRAIKAHALKAAGGVWGIGLAGVDEINELGIVASTLKAMKRALVKLYDYPELILIDGTFRTDMTTWFSSNTLWSDRADSTYYCVAAASILAKTYRDCYMDDLANKYPRYLLQQNKGYGTLGHRIALIEHGVTPCHRKKFCSAVRI